MPVLSNPQYELFARLRAEGMNGTKAAIEAGWSEKSAARQATRLSKNVQVQARIQELLAEAANRAVERTALTETYVINKLMTNVEHTTNPNSDKWNPSAANRSLELLGKKLALWVDRVDDRRRAQDFQSLDELDAAQTEVEAEIKALEERKQELLGEGEVADGDGTVH